MARDIDWGKRIFDLILAWGLTILAAPLFLIIAVLIKLTSKGPVLFRQVRLGENKTPFVLYKFRSMYNNTSHEIHKEYAKELIKNNKKAGRAYKLENDPRVTPFGRWLRRTSLDELPQIFNVLKGEMSFVGPRPPIPYEVEHYSPEHVERLKAKPGITGLWQVSGRTLLPFEEQVKLDLEYIRKRSFSKDLVILIKTIPVILKGEGAF